MTTAACSAIEISVDNLVEVDTVRMMTNLLASGSDSNRSTTA